MQSLAKQVLEHATGLPEGTPLVAKELLHLGNRAAVDQVLSRLARRGALLRAGRGIYVLPVESRFGIRSPSASKMVEGLAHQRGETIVSHGAAAANALGLTTQVPVRSVYLTSGPSRRLKLGAQTIELRHAPVWQLIFPGRAAGDVVRALAWLGPERAGEALHNMDGEGSERAGVAWLSSSISPAMNVWKPWPRRPTCPAVLPTCWKRMLGWCGLCVTSSPPPTRRISPSRVAPRCRRPTGSSGVFPRTWISPMTSAPSPAV